MRNRSVLIVDDDPAMRALLADSFAHAGWRVLHAGDGVELLGCLAYLEADLVVTDVRMPRLSGLDALEQARERAHRCPFIVMSGFGMDDARARAHALGAAAIFDKPFDVRALVACASQLVSV